MVVGLIELVRLISKGIVDESRFRVKEYGKVDKRSGCGRLGRD